MIQIQLISQLLSLACALACEEVALPSTNVSICTTARAWLVWFTVGIRAGAFSERNGEALLRQVRVRETWRAVWLSARENSGWPRAPISVLSLTHPPKGLELTFAVINFSLVEESRRTTSKGLLVNYRDIESLSIIAPLMKLRHPVDAFPSLLVYDLVLSQIFPRKDDLK